MSRPASKPSCSIRSLRASILPRLAAALKPERDLQFQFLGLQTLYDRYFLQTRGIRFELPQAFFMRVAMGLAMREIDREARAIEFYDLISSFDFMCSTPTLFNAGTLAAAALVLLPDDGVRRSRRHLQVDQGQRAAGQILRRSRQRLEPRARPRRAHQGHQRREPGRGAVPEGRQRHGDCRQPGRQAQGRGVRLSRDLAHRHRGVPRSAQEHRRRPAPHARHEHGQLGAGPVHAARRRGRPMDAVLARRGARAARSLRPGLRRALPLLRAEGRAHGDARRQAGARRRPVAAHADHAVRDRASLGHVQGPVQHPLAAAALRRHPFLEPVHRDHAQHLGRRGGGLQPRLDQSCRARDGEGPRSGPLGADGQHRHAHARQRHRHQFLHDPGGAPLQPAPPPGRTRPDGLPGRAARSAHRHSAREEAVAFADTSMEAISYCAISASVDLAAERGRYASFDGSLWSRGILPIDSLKLLADARGEYLRLDTSATLDWQCLARARRDRRHAQFQRHGHRADRDDLQHRRRGAVDRAGVPQSLRQGQHVGRLHGREPVPRARPQGARPVGRGDDLGPQVLRRLRSAPSTACRRI